jgi:hypothetical protein
MNDGCSRHGRDVLESEAPAGPREVSSTRCDCLAPWELRSRSACLAMAIGSWPSYAADMMIDVVVWLFGERLLVS